MSISDLVFKKSLMSLEDLENLNPERNLPEGAMVTRVGPSPTGMMHIGTLYVGRICAHLAKQTRGVSILRIEDTDKKREVEGATEFVVKSFYDFGITFNEGIRYRHKTEDSMELSPVYESGYYGPYKQSDRRSIYHAYIKHLLDNDMAYLCFSTPEELDEMRRNQRISKSRPGYYGKWALWRNRSEEETLKALEEGKPFVIRFKSNGNYDQKFSFEDLIFGKRELPENDIDIVLMKSDGLPTYHLAHVVDDHLMRTTHVIRGDEWFSSIPTHLQLFDAFNWKAPAYAHIAPINKMDGTSKRKLSKRKDPEASVEFFEKQGYPKEAILDYLMTLSDAKFEAWKNENPEMSSWDFEITMKGLQGSNGPLFDFDKLNNISKNYIAKLTSQEVYYDAFYWAKKHDPELADKMKNNLSDVHNILSIERSGPNVRKDIAKWEDIKEEIEYFFDDTFSLQKEEALEKINYLSPEELKNVVTDFLADYDPKDEKDIWFGKIKQLAEKHGFALRPKDYKKNPEAYKGNVADVAKIFRILLTGKERTPDLHAIMLVMGLEKVEKRLSLVM